MSIKDGVNMVENKKPEYLDQTGSRKVCIERG